MQIYGASFIRRQDCVKVWCVFVILHLNLEFQTVGNTSSYSCIVRQVNETTRMTEHRRRALSAAACHLSPSFFGNTGRITVTYTESGTPMMNWDSQYLYHFSTEMAEIFGRQAHLLKLFGHAKFQLSISCTTIVMKHLVEITKYTTKTFLTLKVQAIYS